MPLEPLAPKWDAFGWHVIEVDGHDLAQLIEAFGQAKTVKGQPTVVIAHTVKGKGVSFMEDRLAWHYQSPDADELRQALSEVAAR